MSHLPDSHLLPADVCIQELIRSGGNTHLAAERLFGSSPTATADLIASIAQDPLAQQNLNAQLRTLTTLRAFDALTKAHNLLDAQLLDMEPADFVKFYTSMIKQIAELADTATPADPGDTLVKLLQVLPPEARRAFITLARPASVPSADVLPLGAGADATDIQIVEQPSAGAVTTDASPQSPGSSDEAA